MLLADGGWWASGLWGLKRLDVGEMGVFVFYMCLVLSVLNSWACESLVY